MNTRFTRFQWSVLGMLDVLAANTTDAFVPKLFWAGLGIFSFVCALAARN